MLYYYGFPLTEQEYDQKYSVFTAPYAVVFKARPDAPITDSALFRSVAALANHTQLKIILSPEIRCCG